MPRLLSIALTCLLSLALIGPVLPKAEPTVSSSSLPPCCRNDGKHRCASRMAAKASAAGPTVRSDRCAQWPQSKLAHRLPFAGLTGPQSLIATGIASAPSPVPPVRDGATPSAMVRSCPKRGPPTLS